MYRRCTKTCLIDTDTRYCSETLNRYRYRYKSIARYVSPIQVSRYCPSLSSSNVVVVARFSIRQTMKTSQRSNNRSAIYRLQSSLCDNKVYRFLSTTTGLPKLFRSQPLLIFQNFSRPFTAKITNSAKYAFVIIIERLKLKTSYRYSIIYLFYFCGIFILLSRESNQCAIRARSGVASHLFTHQHGVIPLSACPTDTTSKLAGLFFTLSLYC